MIVFLQEKFSIFITLVIFLLSNFIFAFSIEEERNELRMLLSKFSSDDYRQVEKLQIVYFCCRLVGPFLVGITHFILYKRFFK